jgi:pyridoxamine 5'-phosphate oxidase
VHRRGVGAHEPKRRLSSAAALRKSRSVSDRERDLAERLRGLSVLQGDADPCEPGQCPEHPAELFLAWLEQAIDAGVREPHAMTLSTVDSAGRPNSRVLILKGLEDGRWIFATSRASPKGMEIASTPWAALNFYWPELGRQVRIRGRVIDAGPVDSAKDFLDRPTSSRAASLPNRQSEPLTDPAEVEEAFDAAAAAIESDPNLVPDHWGVFHLDPDEAEFWQADPDRRHTRLRYELSSKRWSQQRLWP